MTRTIRQRRGFWPTPRGSIARLIHLLVAVPLVAVVGFAGLAMLGSAREMTAAGDLRRLVDVSTEAGAVARQLQAERVAASLELTTAGDAARSAFTDQIARTDTAIAGFQRRRTALAGATAALRPIDSGIATLTTVRDEVLLGPVPSLSSLATSYRIVIADILAFRESIAMAAPARVAGDIRAAAAVARASEALGRQQVVVLDADAAGELSRSSQRESAGEQADFAEARAEFRTLARPAWDTRWDQLTVTAKVAVARRMDEELGRAKPGNRLRIDVAEWVDATDDWITGLYGIQRLADDAVAGDVAATRRARLREAVALGAGMLLVLASTVVLAVAVVRRITRRLRMLRDSTETVTRQSLPEAVRRLNAFPPGTDPDETAGHPAAEFAVPGRDEIADLGGALRSLHRAAVRIAGEQAAMRARAAEIFVMLSQRGQRLVDAMLATVDTFERDEVDPARLQQLYELDHLATQTARANRSLLVLGGSSVSRVRHEPVTLVNVIWAAQSQIEHYTRVRVGTVERGLAVAGRAADEIVHLLAELLDNATAYSSPDKEVRISGHVASGHAVIEVVDEGVGLSPRRRAQLNAQLGKADDAEFNAMRSVGLTVVSRLAARHGVSVVLRPSSPFGTVAEIVIPSAVLTQETAPGESQPSPLPRAGVQS